MPQIAMHTPCDRHSACTYVLFYRYLDKIWYTQLQEKEHVADASLEPCNLRNKARFASFSQQVASLWCYF